MQPARVERDVGRLLASREAALDRSQGSLARRVHRRPRGALERVPARRRDGALDLRGLCELRLLVRRGQPLQDSKRLSAVQGVYRRGTHCVAGEHDLCGSREPFTC